MIMFFGGVNDVEPPAAGCCPIISATYSPLCFTRGWELVDLCVGMLKTYVNDLVDS